MREGQFTARQRRRCLRGCLWGGASFALFAHIFQQMRGHAKAGGDAHHLAGGHVLDIGRGKLTGRNLAGPFPLGYRLRECRPPVPLSLNILGLFGLRDEPLL